ncbi:MAG: hypothetical protein GY862_08680 [Gammaproteobacteria bacterium]|nr:hypothetical protein [Gammaproteobacteria bacterium]
MKIRFAVLLGLLLSLSVAAMAEDASSSAAIEKKTERGPVSVQVRLEPATPLIGDVVTLTLEVTAEEGVELLMPEFGQSLDRFSILDFVPRERLDDQGRTVALQRYRLQPPMSGKQSVPPIMIEFVDRRPGQRAAPEDEDAYEILTERMDFEVGSVTPEGAADDLKPPLGRLEALAVPTASIWPWLLALIVILAVASPFAWRYWSAWRGRARRRSAYDIAHARLQALVAKPRPQADTIVVFFVELSDIIRHYLEDRFELHAPELTTEEFLDVAAGSPDLNAGHKGFLREFLRSADRVKFARHVPAPEYIEMALATAGNFLEQTREDAPLMTEKAESFA